MAVRARHFLCQTTCLSSVLKKRPRSQSFGIWHSADDVLDAEEDFDDDLGDGGHDYADLAAAMASPEESTHSDEEEEEGSGSESEDRDMPTDDEEEDVSSDDERSNSSGSNGMSRHDSDELNQEVDDELNPFELAEATDSDNEPLQKGTILQLTPSRQAFNKLGVSLNLPGDCFVG